MPRRSKLEPHPTLAGMAARHARAPDAVTREHWPILSWLASGTQAARVARLTGSCAKWGGLLARCYNRDGPAAVEEQRHHNRGAKPLFTGE